MDLTIAPTVDALAFLQRREAPATLEPRFEGQPRAARAISAVVHLSALVTGPVGPALSYLLLRRRAFQAAHAREALNFTLSALLLGTLGLGVLLAASVIVAGYLAPLLIPVLVAAELGTALFGWVMTTLGASRRALRGGLVHYPATLRVF